MRFDADANPALPGKWQPVEEVIYLLVFEGETPETQGHFSLTARLLETLLIPILDEWNEPLWEVERRETLVVDLQTGGDCREGYAIRLSETESFLALRSDRIYWGKGTPVMSLQRLRNLSCSITSPACGLQCLSVR